MIGTAGLRSWLARVIEIGEAYLDVVRAEIAAVREDLGASGRALTRALIWIAVTFAVAFWALGLTLYLAIELLTLMLPRWAAAAVVLGVFLLAVTIFALLARSSLRRVESPAAVLRRRYEEHRGWWQSATGAEPGGDAQKPEQDDET